MSIFFTCSCGKRLKVADQFRGKRCKCPGCKEIRIVPERSAGEEESELADESASAAGKSRRATSGIRARRREDNIPEVLPADDSNEAAHEPRSEEEEPRRLKKPRRKKRAKKKRFFSGFEFGLERSLANKGALAGVLMMVIAVVWFVCGLIFLNRIFFYPPVLFIVGLIAFIKGLVS